MALTRRDFLTSITAMASAATLPPGVANGANPRKTFQQLFSRPPAQARPWVRWWWPSGAVADEELRREIRLLDQAGFGGAEIQAFNPGIPHLSKQERARINDYANPAFFAHVDVCTDQARQQGLQIDLTFGSAWPSGGGFAITPELALIELTPAVTSVQAPLTAPIRLQLPAHTRKMGAISPLDARANDPRAADWRDRIAARQKLVAVVAIKSTAPVLENDKNFRSSVVKTAGKADLAEGIVVTDRLGPDGVLDWVPPSAGQWQIVAFKQFVVDSPVLAGVGEGPQLVLDHFKRDAFDAHARRVGAPLAANGKPARALRATFIDSLELMPDLYWSEDLLDQFQARRGYDLTPYLPHLLQPGWMESWNPHVSLPYFDAGHAGDRIRADYRLTLSELIIENFYRPFVDWNHGHGLLGRVQAHGAPGDLLKIYGLADIPETEDLEGTGNTHFLRLARAAANLYGRKRVSCESLCWPLRSFEVTPAQWQARVNLLFASGVNAIVMHGFPYALHRETWPGWYPFAPSPFLPGFSSMINEGNPLWNAIGCLNTYIGGVQGIMQNSDNVVPLAVYLGDSTYFHGIEPQPTEELITHLLDNGYDYDRINDDSIAQSHVLNRELVTQGGARYAALILPARPSLPAPSAMQLARFARAGLPIFFAEQPPTRAAGYRDHAAQDRLVRESVQAALQAGARLARPESLAATLRQAKIPDNLAFTSAPCLFIEKTLDGRSAYFLHNPKDHAVTVSFTTRAAGHPERWNPATGERAGLHARFKDGRTEVSVDIAAGGAALLVFTDRRLAPPPVWLPTDWIDLSAGPWTLAIDGHGQHGKAVQRSLTLDRLRDWRAIDGLADFSGQGTYRADVMVPAEWLKADSKVLLDLGAVRDMAIVTFAGKPQLTLIAPPFEADVTAMLRPGVNQLQIGVFNSPNNAMIDLKKPGLKNLAPQPAGLLGPIKLVLKRPKTAP
ncbi:hypothetical protein FHW83_003323 [Duganella sp. SG902]|uniref:glycosyl hydrolase n=1 Tax=Duganella sp. SG902 TaxID=2587016 RepID=UPI00159E6A4A|nr:glycosyl hydrolase [Duganella sp. SG902]NVM77505.1 hypothetical protein [Duganella sp. SG902]